MEIDKQLKQELWTYNCLIPHGHSGYKQFFFIYVLKLTLHMKLTLHEINTNSKNLR